tara:strand:- start:440 stop:580 length:141 start_codon:yes stop_codon:yes gene_type:complete
VVVVQEDQLMVFLVQIQLFQQLHQLVAVVVQILRQEMLVVQVEEVV